MIIENYDTMKQARKRAKELKKTFGDSVEICNIRDRWCFLTVELVYKIKPAQ